MTIKDTSLDGALGTRTRGAGWKVRTNPLSYVATMILYCEGYFSNKDVQKKRSIGQMLYDKFSTHPTRIKLGKKENNCRKVKGRKRSCDNKEAVH